MIGALVLAAAARPQEVVVGSKNFTESHLLGSLVAELLEDRLGHEVEHRSGLGGTLVCFEALLGGEIDVYVEYTGTAWAVILGRAGAVKDPLRAFLEVERGLRAEHDLEWLAPLGFQNTYALAMRSERADELGISTVSDLARAGAGLRAGFSHEFLEREDGWPGLAAHYDLELAEVRGLEHGLAYGALAEGALDVIDAYSTDAKLLRYGLTLLEDDRGFFPPYHAAPVVRGELLRQRPEVGAALRELAYCLDERRMAELNLAVELEGRSFEAVAREFLEAEGLLAVDAAAATTDTERPRGWLAYFLSRWRETLALTWQHLLLTGLAVGLAALVAIPLGVAITRSRWAERLSLGAAGVVQTIPSLALLAFMIALPGLGLSMRSAVVALTLYAVLPILRNTFAGLRAVDPDLVDAARGMGLTERQVLTHVQLPLATGTIMAGVRTATVVTIGFATLAAFIGAGGLGEPIVTGLYLNDRALILTGALPAALLALLADGLLGRLERRWER